VDEEATSIKISINQQFIELPVQFSSTLRGYVKSKVNQYCRVFTGIFDYGQTWELIKPYQPLGPDQLTECIQHFHAVRVF